MKTSLRTVLLALALVPSLPAAQRGEASLPRMRVLVPAYFYPVAGSPWERLTAAAALHPGRVAAIGNPASGPGASPDPSYVAAFGAFRAAGGTLLGYVPSGYGARPSAMVEAEMALWFGWYDAAGIFLDEMDNVPGAHEAYYRGLYAWLETNWPGKTLVANPGTASTLDYLDGAFGRCADALCLFESSAAFRVWSPDPWTVGRPRREVYALPYGVGASEWPAVVDHAARNRVGWLYTTDDVLPNPWDTLPSWFEAFVARVADGTPGPGAAFGAPSAVPR